MITVILPWCRVDYLTSPTYAKSVRLGIYGGSSTSEWWNLSRKCTRLASVVGQDDTDDAANTFQAAAAADSVDLWSGSVSLGHPASVDVDVSGYLRLVLSASGSVSGHVAWGDARVLCAK